MLDNSTLERFAAGDAKPAPAPVTTIAPQQSEAASLIAAITAMAQDPRIDATKLSSVIALHERGEETVRRASFTRDMLAAQTEMRPISANAENDRTGSRYATFDALNEAARPIYTRHGFTLGFDTESSPLAEHVRVICRVAHRDGHENSHQLDMPCDGASAYGDDLTKIHAAKSAVTYGRRGLLEMIFNLSVSKDDDGNGASAVNYVTTDQLQELVDLLDETGANRERFLAMFQISTLAHLPAEKFNQAFQALQAKRAA